jgi:glucokinase
VTNRTRQAEKTAPKEMDGGSSSCADGNQSLCSPSDKLCVNLRADENPIVNRQRSERGKQNKSARRWRLSPETLFVGVDIGGTKVAAGLVDAAGGKICAQVRTPMAACGKAQDGLAAVKTAIDLLLKNTQTKVRDVRGIGVCAPGPLDPSAGVIVNPPNVPCWRDFPLAAEVRKLYGVSVKLDNDANAAGLAETIWGAGRGYGNVFYVTIGTGIGTGIVLDGKILHGRTGAAGEGGHVSIDYRGPKCACGKRGCIETLAAGPAIAKAAQAKLSERPGDSRVLLELAGGKNEAVTSELVGQAFAKGDGVAKQVLEQTVQYLAYWLGNVIDLLEPEVVIIGGGVSLMLRPFFSELSRKLPAHCENQRAGETPIVAAHYGEDAGVIGGAALCLDARDLALVRRVKS